jgi:hypothetical protein
MKKNVVHTPHIWNNIVRLYNLNQRNSEHVVYHPGLSVRSTQAVCQWTASATGCRN